jgi:hypothetical protein
MHHLVRNRQQPFGGIHYLRENGQNGPVYTLCRRHQMMMERVMAERMMVERVMAKRMMAERPPRWGQTTAETPQ